MLSIMNYGKMAPLKFFAPAFKALAPPVDVKLFVLSHCNRFYLSLEMCLI